MVLEVARAGSGSDDKLVPFTRTKPEVLVAASLPRAISPGFPNPIRPGWSVSATESETGVAVAGFTALTAAKFDGFPDWPDGKFAEPRCR